MKKGKVFEYIVPEGMKMEIPSGLEVKKAKEGDKITTTYGKHIKIIKAKKKSQTENIILTDNEPDPWRWKAGQYMMVRPLIKKVKK